MFPREIGCAHQAGRAKRIDSVVGVLPTGLLVNGAFAPYGRFAAGKTAAQAEFTSAAHCKHRGVERANGPRNQKRKGFRSEALSFWKGRLKSIFPIYDNTSKGSPLPAFWPAALLRRKFGAAKGGEELRRGGFADPEHSNAEGWSDQRERNPKRKARRKSCLSFWWRWGELNPRPKAL